MRYSVLLENTTAKTKNPILKTVRENTEEIVGYYKSLGLDVTWELNPGSHFREPDLRTAKRIMAIL